MNDFPLLTLILFTPLIGAVALLLVPKRNEDAIRWIANLFALAGFLVSLPLWFAYDQASPSYQFVERHAWIPSIGAKYPRRGRGSPRLILLSALMGVIAVLVVDTIKERVKELRLPAPPQTECSGRSSRSTSCCSSCSGR